MHSQIGSLSTITYYSIHMRLIILLYQTLGQGQIVSFLQEVAAYQDQEPLVASATFAPTFHKLMGLIVKSCENLSAGVDIDLCTFPDSKSLHDKYIMIEINDGKEEIPVSIGHTNQFPVAPAVEVSCLCYQELSYLSPVHTPGFKQILGFSKLLLLTATVD